MWHHPKGDLGSVTLTEYDIPHCGNKAGHSPCSRRLHMSIPCPFCCQHPRCSLPSPPTEPQVLGARCKKDPTGRLALKNSQGSEDTGGT